MSSVIDANNHILQSTFTTAPNHLDMNKLGSLHSIVSHQERLIQKGWDRILDHNLKLSVAKDAEITANEEKGIFCCPFIDETSQCRCVHRFQSKQARDKHIEIGKHKFPTVSLSTWIHDMHLNGNFAFSLAVGSRKNRSKFINDERPFETIRCSTFPDYTSSLIDDIWYRDGCYRKHRKAKFRASEALKADLEALFLEGFEKDGPKQGKNKYTPEQAFAFLKNLKMNNGRRKYSHHENNINGALPSILYIQGWFSCRKNKMAEEERKRHKRRREIVEESFCSNNNEASFSDDDDILGNRSIGSEFDAISEENDTSDDDNDNDNVAENKFSNMTLVELQTKVSERLSSRFTQKSFCIKLLQNDDFLNKNEQCSYTNEREKVLSKICTDRGLLSNRNDKSALISFLLCDDKVRALKKCLPQLKAVVLQHEVIEDETNNSLL